MHDNPPSPPLRSGMRRRLRLKGLAAGICVLALLGAAVGCSKSNSSSSSSSGSTSGTTASSSGSAFPGGTSLQGKTILMVIYTAPIAAWTPSLNAVKSVEASTGLKVNVEYANNNNETEISEIESGISRNVAGMALQITSTAMAGAVCNASKKGIPILAWNQDALTGASANCVQAYMGQNFVTAGQVLGQYMIQHGYVKNGAQVFCPVEDPTATYASGREQGVNQALATVGAKCSVLAVGDADAGAISAMTEYLLGHRKTTAIIALGGIPTANAPAVLKKVGLNIPVAGFDVYDPRIPKAIEAGTITAAVDQQFYSQAYYAAQQLALELQYGLYPSDMSTGGRGVITKANVGDLLTLSGQYR
jgi:simple sugar transport system substrate-binding protein